jgi:hypothetical protein
MIIYRCRYLVESDHPTLIRQSNADLESSFADPGGLSRIQIFSILEPNFSHPGSEFFPSRIPDPHPHQRILVF